MSHPWLHAESGRVIVRAKWRDSSLKIRVGLSGAEARESQSNQAQQSKEVAAFHQFGPGMRSKSDSVMGTFHCTAEMVVTLTAVPFAQFVI